MQQLTINHYPVQSDYLNIAGMKEETRVLGPGLRMALWLQGCPFHCYGCIAPDWIPMRLAKLVKCKDLVIRFLLNPALVGLTISGGEPMLHALPLVRLIKTIRKSRDIDVICFSGYQYETLLTRPPNQKIHELLGEVDLLIDGPYIVSQNDDRGLRGSTNQRFIRLTDRFSSDNFTDLPRNIEIDVMNSELFIVGIPDRSTLTILGSVLDPG